MELRSLIIKKQYLDLILKGQKIWELRGSKTLIRGKIGLIESGSGLVIATAEVVDCHGPFTRTDLINHISKTQYNPQNTILKYKQTYAWELKNIKVFSKPIPYKHPQGAIIWVKVSV